MKKSILIFLLGISIGSGMTAVAFYAYLPREVNEFNAKNKVKGRDNTMSIDQVKEQYERDCEKEIEKAVKEALKKSNRKPKKRKR